MHSTNTDSDGYLLLDKVFDFKSHTYEFQESLGENWHIYKQSDKETKQFRSFELVRFEKQEEYTIAGNTVSKRWTYPNNESWGVRGFTYKTVQDCHKKFNELMGKPKTVEKTKGKFILPVNQNFIIKDLAAKFGVDILEVLTYVKSLGDKVKVVGEQKNTRGRASKVYLFKP